jgi:hypothetical protein
MYRMMTARASFPGVISLMKEEIGGGEGWFDGLETLGGGEGGGKSVLLE